MSDDPMRMSGLDAEAIGKAVEVKQLTKKAKDPIAVKNAETAAKREERLASKSVDPGPSTLPPPPPTPIKDKSLLLDKIQQYREKFPELKSRNKLSGKSTSDEIEDELHYIEQQLGASDGHMGHHIFVLAMSGLEESTRYYNPLGLNLTGLGNVARENEDQFKPLLDELVIKYATNFYVGPEMRLAMATATLVYTVHMANSGNPAMAQAMQSMARKVSTDKGKDL